MGRAKKRVVQLQAQAFAHEVILQQLARDLWRSDLARNLKRETICDTVEAMFESGETIEHNQVQMHQVLGAVDEVFRNLPPLADSP